MKRRNRIRLFLVPIMGLLWTAVVVNPSSGATISIIFTDSPGEGFLDPTLGFQRRTALDRAVIIWAGIIDSSVVIEITVHFDPLDNNPADGVILASAGPEGVFFGGGLPAGLQFVSALANSLAGMDLDPGFADIDAVFNSDVDTGAIPFNWYYGLDGNPPGNDADFVTTALHAKCCQRPLRQLERVLAVERHRPAGGWLEGTEGIQERALATPRRPHDRG